VIDVRPATSLRSAFLSCKAPRRAIRPDLVSDVTRRACDRAGLPRVGVHRLRHTLATEMLRRGAKLVDIGQVLRHRDLESGQQVSVTIVEPGMARTNFGTGSFALGAPLPEYADGPSGQLRRVISGELPPLPTPGDPAKIAAAIIASADQPQAPFRLTLGSDAYALATAALRDRLEAMEAGRNLAYSTDADDVVYTPALTTSTSH
jgi:hypothetical protein